MAGSMHNTRLLRFLIVLTIVVLTIFIYTSYSSTQTLAPPPMRSASLVAYSLLNNRSTLNELDSSAGNNEANRVSNSNTVDSGHKSFIYHENVPHASSLGGSHGNEMMFIKKLTHHREPTIDINAVDDDGGGGGGIAGGLNGMDAVLEGQGLDDRPLSNPTGDENAADEMALERFSNNNNDLMQEEQYVQAVDNTLGNINNSVTSAANNGAGGLASSDTNQQLKQHHQQQTLEQLQQQQDQQINANANNNINNLNKIPESDVLIPTSNLQKFIESADKILKNITVQQQQPASVAPADNINKSGDKEELAQPAQSDTPNDTKHLIEDNESGEALPPSVIMTIKGAGVVEATAEKNKGQHKQSSASVLASVAKVTSTTKKVPKIVATDPTQGIPTKQIYESGHLNEEIDINQICPNRGEKLKLLIIITSAQSHAEARLAIRQTWGHFGSRRDVSTAFILGRTTNATVSLSLTQENFIYGDLIRGHFIDSYNNLTLKTLSSLEWVDQNCPKAKYILKTDDDMFINVPKLLEFLDAHAKDKRVIYGRLAKKWKPIRNKKSKYYISTGQFGAAIFPPFTTGPAYVMTNDVVHDLYKSSLEQLYLKLEDVFTTGIVAQKLGIKRVHDNMFLNRRIAFNPCNIRKAISVHMIKPNEQFDLWKKLLDQTTKCK